MLRERVIDPESRVVISTDTEERSNSASDNGGDVTVASNLPDGEAGTNTSNSQNSETRERVNYEISETEREITLAPGAIKRLSVAVLVNGLTRIDETGATVFEARSEAELSDLRDLVASVIGYDEARGDMLTLRTLEFETAGPVGTASENTFFSSLNLDLMSLAQAAVLALVALVLGLFVLRPVLSRAASTEVPRLAASPRSATNTPPEETAPPSPDAGALTGEIDPLDAETDTLKVVTDGPTLEDLGELSLGNEYSADLPAISSETNPVDRLRALIDDRREETVEILRSWLEGEEEKA
jgi:flagellar M-ring protein FliF